LENPGFSFAPIRKFAEETSKEKPEKKPASYPAKKAKTYQLPA
jgi:hypothetical protein